MKSKGKNGIGNYTELKNWFPFYSCADWWWLSSERVDKLISVRQHRFIASNVNSHNASEQNGRRSPSISKTRVDWFSSPAALVFRAVGRMNPRIRNGDDERVVMDSFCWTKPVDRTKKDFSISIVNKSITWLYYFNYRYVDFCIGNSMQMRNVFFTSLLRGRKCLVHTWSLSGARARSHERENLQIRLKNLFAGKSNDAALCYEQFDQQKTSSQLIGIHRIERHVSVYLSSPTHIDGVKVMLTLSVVKPSRLRSVRWDSHRRVKLYTQINKQCFQCSDILTSEQTNSDLLYHCSSTASDENENNSPHEISDSPPLTQTRISPIEPRFESESIILASHHFWLRFWDKWIEVLRR